MMNMYYKWKGKKRPARQLADRHGGGVLFRHFYGADAGLSEPLYARCH